MAKTCTIVTYHYIRELPYSRYPNIKGLLVNEFKNQLDYFSRFYNFVTIRECLDAIYSGGELPENAILLTFDDGYIDHYLTVFPLLEEKKIQGCFFPPAKAIMENIVLDVNKIHFTLASTKNINDLLEDIYNYLDYYRKDYSLKSNEYYFSELSKPGRYDPEEVAFVKRLFQYALNPEVRSLILNELFCKYVTSDEKAFAKELYMSTDQLRLMNMSGMYIGNHGYNHVRLNTLSQKEQIEEINQSLDFLNTIGFDADEWIISYPYGNFNESLLNIIKDKNCRLGFSTNPGIAQLTPGNAYSLERLDTNDFPKKPNASKDS